MTNKDYWARRAEARMSGYMRQSEAVAKELETAYEGVYRYVNEESKAILQTFQRVHVLSEAEAKALLKVVSGKDAPSKIKEILAKTKDPKKAAELKMLLESPAYKYRIARLQKVLDSVDGMAKDVYGVELTRTTRHYRDLFDEAYMRSMFDTQRGTGLGFSFAAVDPNTVDAVLAYEWSGEHYSSRIWGHCSNMAQTVKDELLIGVLTGRSWRKMADNVAERCGVGAFEARRLVRTESAAIASRAEQAMYNEAGIERYEYLATLDNRTSEECQALDGKVLAVKDGKIGVNMPPMHAFCRSTTVAYFDDEVIDGLQRRARDPETGKTYTVPQNMTYKEWKKFLAENNGEYCLSETGEQGSYKANLERIASDEYRRAFDGIFKSAKLCSEVCKESRRAIRINDGSDVENYAMIFEDGTKTVTGRTGAHGGTVDLSALQGKPEGSVVFTHNHPGSGSFSAYDIDVALRNPQIKTIVAAGHDGKVYKLTIGTGRRTLDRNIFTEYNITVRQTGTSHTAVEALAKKYEWRYEVIE